MRALTYPALVTNTLRASTTDTDTNNVGGGVEEVLAVANELPVTDGLDKGVDGHGGDEALVANGGAIRHLDGLVASVHLGNLALLTVASVLLGDGVGNSKPDTTSTAVSGETEGSVGTPVTSGLVQDDVAGHSLQVGGSDTLTEPGTLHLQRFSICVAFHIGMIDGETYLGGRHSPDLVVVGSHENIGNTSTHHADDPLIEVLGLGVGHTALHGSVNHAVNALDLLLLGEHGNVVLEGVRDPLASEADVGDTLVGVPVVIAGEGLVDAVIKVLVVREDDVSTDIVKLQTQSVFF